MRNVNTSAAEEACDCLLGDTLSASWGVLAGECWSERGVLAGGCWSERGVLVGECWSERGVLLGE